MPAKPGWYANLDNILATLEAIPRPYIDRATVERLLGIGRRQAQKVMAPCVEEWIGSSGLAERHALMSHLRRLAAGDHAGYERRRRHKVAALLQQLHDSWTRQPPLIVEAPTSVVNQKFNDLAGIRLEPGRITIEFDQPREALERLLALAMAIGNDMESFDRLTTQLPG
jgi:hypothetical protein